MDESAHDLCQQILEKCQQQEWYGPDMYVPRRLQRELQDGGTRFWYDRNNQQYPINRHTDTKKIPTTWAFEYAPLSQEQLQEAEQLLGFSLPPLLQTMYTRVADGGFGPGYGLYHILARGENMMKEYLVSRRKARPVDLHLFEQHAPGQNITMIPAYLWPDGFLCLCHWGCAIFSYLEMSTGRVFREAYYEDDKHGFEEEAPTLAAWFQRWLEMGMEMFYLEKIGR